MDCKGAKGAASRRESESPTRKETQSPKRDKHKTKHTRACANARPDIFGVTPAGMIRVGNE